VFAAEKVEQVPAEPVGQVEFDFFPEILDEDDEG